MEALLAASTAKCCPVPRHNNEKTFLIWINEEDHTRIISMEKGGNMKRVFERFCRGLKEVSTHRPLPCQTHRQVDRGTQGHCRLCVLYCPRAGQHPSALCSRRLNCFSHPGGAANPGARLGVHVEREAGIHPYLPLQPGHRAASRRPHQAAAAQQGSYHGWFCGERAWGCGKPQLPAPGAQPRGEVQDCTGAAPDLVLAHQGSEAYKGPDLHVELGLLRAGPTDGAVQGVGGLPRGAVGCSALAALLLVALITVVFSGH